MAILGLNRKYILLILVFSSIVSCYERDIQTNECVRYKNLKSTGYSFHQSFPFPNTVADKDFNKKVLSCQNTAYPFYGKLVKGDKSFVVKFEDNATADFVTYTAIEDELLATIISCDDEIEQNSREIRIVKDNIQYSFLYLTESNYEYLNEIRVYENDSTSVYSNGKNKRFYHHEELLLKNGLNEQLLNEDFEELNEDR